MTRRLLPITRLPITRLAALALGLLALPTPAHAEPAGGSAARERRPVRGYLQLGWRALGLAEHLSHGPDYGLGLVLFDAVKIGVGGFARPGPINPATFVYDLPDGTTYRGQTQLELRGDGALVGLQVVPYFELPWLAGVRVELPVIVGSGLFGYYLTGDDRETPDGRRVSAWENELLDGGDSSGGLGLDVGIRVAFALPKTDLVRPFAALHWTTVFGFDATLRDDYQGPSAALGILLETR